MGSRQIRDMDVVPDRSSIRGRVVRAEDVYCCPVAAGRGDGKRDEACHLIVVFAKVAIGVSSGGVEVAEGHPAQPVRLAVGVKNALYEQLGLPIRADGLLRMVLPNRQRPR